MNKKSFTPKTRKTLLTPCIIRIRCIPLEHQLTTMTKQAKKIITARVSPETLKALKLLAKKRKRTPSKIVDEILTNHFK